MEFQPDKWLRVTTNSKESARRFFGAPDNWPCEFEGFSQDPDKPGRVFRVLAEGLTVQ